MRPSFSPTAALLHLFVVCSPDICFVLHICGRTRLLTTGTRKEYISPPPFRYYFPPIILCIYCKNIARIAVHIAVTSTYSEHSEHWTMR